jgi:hypothetical protein
MQSSGAGLDNAFQFYSTDGQQQSQTSPGQGQQLPDRDAQQQQQSPQGQADKYSFGDSVFMGANTPGR